MTPSVEMEDGETWSQVYFDDHGYTADDGTNWPNGEGPRANLGGKGDLFTADALAPLAA